MIDDTSPEALERSLEALATAYLPGTVIAAAVELGIFDLLHEPWSVEALAGRLDAAPAGVGRMLRALVALRLVEQRDDGRFVLREHAASLLESDAPAGLASLFHHHARQIAPLLLDLPAAVRSGRPRYPSWPFASDPPASSAYGELARHPGEYRAFLDAMDRDSRGLGERIAQTVDLSATDRVLDLGGGGGEVARALLREVPGLSVETIELEPACELARERSHRQGLGDRHHVRVGDLRQPLDTTPAPVILLSGVLADFAPDERAAILTHARDRLEPGGVLIVAEVLLDEHRTSPPSAALLSLVMLAAFRGDQLSEGELRDTLEAAGFADIAVHRGDGDARDLVLARR